MATNVQVKVVKMDGRWHVVRNVIGTWRQETVWGYRSERRAERYAARVRRRWERWERRRERAIGEAQIEDAMIREAISQGGE